MNQLTNPDLISDEPIVSKSAAFASIANLMFKSRKINNPNDVIKGLEKREAEITTGLGEGIAIPHGNIFGLKEPQIVILRPEIPVEWNALDQKPVDLVISILVPFEGAREDHFEILTNLSSQLGNKEIIEKIKTASKEELATLINDIANKKFVVNEELNIILNENEPRLKVVGVTACSVGVAHTFIAATALEKAGAKRGWDIHIEKQGQMTKDALTAKQIAEADYVIFAISMGIEDPERFDGKMVYSCDVAEPITKADKSLDDMLEKAKIQSSDLKGNGNSSVITKEGRTKKTLSTGPMRHLLMGISYMIPFIAMAGITLGFTIAFGFGPIYQFLGVDINEDQYAQLGQIVLTEDGFWLQGGVAITETVPELILGIMGESANASQRAQGQAIVIDIVGSTWYVDGYSNDVVTNVTENLALYWVAFDYFKEIGIPVSDGESISLVVMGGYSTLAPKNNMANAFNLLAGQAFTLYIPILGGYIAYSIAGRKAIAPAMILSLTMNMTPVLASDASLLYVLTESAKGVAAADGGASVFFNWASTPMGFGNFDHPTALGFLGAVAVGYSVGYGTNFFTKYTTDRFHHQAIQTIVPLLIIPLVMTIIPYLFFAFFGYLPIYWFGVGMGALVTLLIANDLLFIAGMILGAMICFDLGGPVNKIAMAIGVAFIATHPEINGIVCVATPIPPMVLLVSLAFCKFTPLKMDEDDKAAAGTAGLMGFFGITEGSIPFAAKEPRKWMPAFMIAGAIGGGIMAPLHVGNNVAMWGGPIIYIAGGYGNAADVANYGFMATNYTYALLYFVPLVIAAFSGFAVASGLQFVYDKLDAKKARQEASEGRQDLTQDLALKLQVA